MIYQRPPTSRRFNAGAWWFLLGLVIFGTFGFAMFFAGAFASGNAAGTIALAVFMIVATAGAALLAFRGGKIGLGSGLLVGYAVAAVASGGQCTYLASASDYGFLGGALVYLYGTALALVVAVGALVVHLVIQSRGGSR